MRIECASRAFTLDTGNTIRMADWSRASARVVLFSPVILLLQQRLWSRNTANSQERELLTWDRVVFLVAIFRARVPIHYSLLPVLKPHLEVDWLDSHWMRIQLMRIGQTTVWTRPIRIRCASNAHRWITLCLSDAHQLNAHSMRIESIHFKMWFQCASNRIAWAIPEVMNNELVHALERWLLGRRHDLTIFRSSRSWLLAVFLDHKRCCRSSITGENNTTRALARDQSAILIVFPVSSVNALDAHSIRINSERFPIGANAHHNRL